MGEQERDLPSWIAVLRERAEAAEAEVARLRSDAIKATEYALRAKAERDEAVGMIEAIVSDGYADTVALRAFLEGSTDG
jgi:hypothetical protein